MAKTAAVLRDQGVVTGWRDEPYPIFGDGAAWTPAADGPLFQVERAVVPWLGARAFGVHINGYVASAESSSSSSSPRRPTALWVARRSKNKPTWPGMLDHLAAGGQPAGMGATANAVKEAWEEAGVPKELCEGGGKGGQAAAACPGGGLRPVGTVTYRGLSSEGLKPDTLFVYDLELPVEFVPEPQDGEVEAFELWSVERVMQALAEAGGERRYPAFKPNVAVVIVDFLVRHGFVGPDTGPEYAEVVAKLRQ
jgi:8-oxo-dGTP pyrophosphatase MutT (NUDIX family)